MKRHIPNIGFRTEKVNGQNVYGMGNIALQIAKNLIHRDDIALYAIRSSIKSHSFYNECKGISIPAYPKHLWDRLAPAYVRLYGLDLMHYPDHNVFPLYCKPARNVIVTIHGLMPFQVPKEMIYKPANKRMIKFLSHPKKYVNAIATVSEFSKKSIIDEFGVPSSMIHVIPNGIDISVFCPNSKLNDHTLRDNGIVPPYILHVSNLKKVKNFETVFEVFKKLTTLYPSLKLVVAGGLPETLFNYQKLIHDSGFSERVKFLGVVIGNSLATLYREASLLLFPSYYESFGLPVLEAMACGCPVIASNIPSFKEFSAECACLFPPTDFEAMAEASHKLLNDPGYRQKLAVRGIKLAGNYTWSVIAEKYAKLYLKIIDKQE